MYKIMKNIFGALFISGVFLFLGCSKTQTQNAKNLLSSQEFSDSLSSIQDEIILDVRTPAEYAGGHIQDAINIDWNNGDFEQKTSSLDKKKTIMVYCLSGGRSAAAASYLRSAGYFNVLELDGGMMAWRAANLPISIEQASQKKGYSKEQFTSLLQAHSMVLIDFYADWCKPCKQLQPILEEIALENASTLKIIRINADENPDLCRELGIDGLPYLQLYKQKSIAWSHMGFIDKQTILSQIK
jgi:thioredoxin